MFTLVNCFFQDEASGNSVSNREKSTLLCLALKWFSGKRLGGKAMSKSSDELAELESQMWLYIINDRIHSAEEVLFSFNFIQSHPLRYEKLDSC